MSSELFGLIKMGADKLKENKGRIDSILKEMWIYLSIVSRANLSKIENESEVEKINKLVRGLPDNIDIARESLDSLSINGCILISTLRHIGRIGVSPKDLFKEAKDALIRPK